MMCQLGSHCGAFRWKANGWPANRLAEASAKSSPQHGWFVLVTGTILGINWAHIVVPGKIAGLRTSWQRAWPYQPAPPTFRWKANGWPVNRLTEGWAIPASNIGGAAMLCTVLHCSARCSCAQMSKCFCRSGPPSHHPTPHSGLRGALVLSDLTSWMA